MPGGPRLKPVQKEQSGEPPALRAEGQTIRSSEIRPYETGKYEKCFKAETRVNSGTKMPRQLPSKCALPIYLIPGNVEKITSSKMAWKNPPPGLDSRADYMTPIGYDPDWLLTPKNRRDRFFVPARRELGTPGRG
jgi:hypothetical protein